MSGVSQATEALRSALYKKGVERHVQDAFSHLASCLVLLNSSSPSVQMITRLRSVLRQPLLPLYGACLQPTLQLSSSLLSVVLDKLCDAHANSEENLRKAWDATAEVILSGVLDFLEQKDASHIESRVTAWESLCRIICDFFFSDSFHGLPIPSIPLSLTAFNVLTEIAIRQPTIQSALRDKVVLGGERLGAAISRTKDYLLAEALLTLFVRLLPPIHNTSQGKFQRIKFVKAVLGSPKLFKCSAELVDIIQKTSGTLWDDVAAQIIDALARSDITHPQPFPIDEIDVCGHVFLQPLATDRLIMDNQAFLVNVVTENDDPCESLQVPYTRIRTVSIDNSRGGIPTGKALITLDLTSPPLVANNEMESLSGSRLYAKFLLKSDDLRRFMEALRRRGVGKLNFANPPTKTVKPSKSISLGSGVKFGDDLTSLAPTSSFEDKVQLVNQVYNTNVEDSTTSEGLPTPHSGKERSSPPSDPDTIIQPATPGQIKPAIPLKSELPAPIQLSPLHRFGKLATITKAGEDTYSDISEFEPEVDSSKKRATTSVFATRRRDPKGKQGTTKRRRIREPDKKSKDFVLGSEKTPELTSKPEDSAPSPLGDKKRVLRSDSPEIDWSSSTRVDVSPRSSSNAAPLVNMDVFGSQVPVSPEALVIHTSPPKALGIKDDVLFDGKSTVGSARNAPAESIATDKGLAECASLQDRSPPPKISGSRRKRETKPSALEAEASGPPHKRTRRAEMEDNDAAEDRSAPMVPVPNAVAPRAKRYSRSKVNKPPPAAELPISGLDELPEKTKPTRASTRRSERIKEQRTTVISGTLTKATHGKTRKGKQADAQMPPTSDLNKPDPVSLPDFSINTSATPPVHTSAAVSPPMITDSLPLSPTTPDYSTAKTGNIVDITQTNHVAQKISEARDIRPREMSRPSVKSSKAPWEDFAQHAVSTVAPTGCEEGFQTEAAQSTKDPYLESDLSPIENDADQLEDVIEYSVSLKGSEDSSEPLRPIESTPRKEIVTIDLTLDDSPIQQKRDLRKGSVVPDRSKADIRVSPNQPKTAPSKQAVHELPTVAPSHQNKRRSVTFASPVHYMLDIDPESEPRVNTSKPVIRSAETEMPNKDPLTSTRSPSPGNDVLSPLIIPMAPANIKAEPFDQALSWEISPKPKSLQGDKRPPYSVPNSLSTTKTISHAKTMNPPTSDDVEIKDIVDVLNEIQGAIIKGVSNRFEKVRKDVRKGRDELVQQVLDELQRMAIDNAKYFNELVKLEAAYHENAKAITRCWEDLIDSNESILVHFQNALKEHDQTAHRLLPKSLSSLKPTFTRAGGRLNV